MFAYNLPASHCCLVVPPSPQLHSSILYYRTYCCTAVPLLCFSFVLYLHTDDSAPIRFFPPFRPENGKRQEYHMFKRISGKFLGYFTNRKRLRFPSSTRPPEASRCHHVPSTQQPYDGPGKERPSVPHLGEWAAWKLPAGDGSLGPRRGGEQ